MKSKQETETQSRPREDRWKWVEETIWTENMLTALGNGVKENKYFANLGLFTMETHRANETACRSR